MRSTSFDRPKISNPILVTPNFERGCRDFSPDTIANPEYDILAESFNELSNTNFTIFESCVGHKWTGPRISRKNRLSDFFDMTNVEEDHSNPVCDDDFSKQNLWIGEGKSKIWGEVKREVRRKPVRGVENLKRLRLCDRGDLDLAHSHSSVYSIHSREISFDRGSLEHSNGSKARNGVDSFQVKGSLDSGVSSARRNFWACELGRYMDELTEKRYNVCGKKTETQEKVGENALKHGEGLFTSRVAVMGSGLEGSLKRDKNCDEIENETKSGSRDTSVSTKAHSPVNENSIGSIRSAFKPVKAISGPGPVKRTPTLEDELEPFKNQTTQKLAEIFHDFKINLLKEGNLSDEDRKLVEISLKFLFDFEVSRTEMSGLTLENQKMIRDFIRDRFFKKKARQSSGGGRRCRRRGKRGSGRGKGRGVSGKRNANVSDSKTLKRVKLSPSQIDEFKLAKKIRLDRGELKMGIVSFVKEHLDHSAFKDSEVSSFVKTGTSFSNQKLKDHILKCSNQINQNLNPSSETSPIFLTCQNEDSLLRQIPNESVGLKGGAALYNPIIAGQSPSFVKFKRNPPSNPQSFLQKRSFLNFDSDSISFSLPELSPVELQSEDFSVSRLQKFLKLRTANELLRLESPQEGGRGKRNDEKIKKIFKRGMKKLLRRFRDSYEGPKQTAVKFEEQFYDYYFGHLGDCLSTFYDPLKKRVKNPRFRSISSEYLSHLKQSDLFRRHMREYCLGDMILDSLSCYPSKLLKRFRENHDFLGGQHRAKSKFEWARHEIVSAVNLFLETFDGKVRSA